jgi:23S rRNA (adenine2503-C2)-methyltransferase
MCMTPDPIYILGLTSAQFIAAAAQRGVKAPRAMEIYRASFREGRAIVPWVAIDVPAVERSHDDNSTIKFTQRQHVGTSGGLESETVIIPMTGSHGRPRKTLCLSSQVGCAMGCTFCETAQMGLMGNLTAAQIVSQWFAARHIIGESIDNIVFMGMGEPMDNFDQVEQAIRVLCDQNGPCIAPARVAVSTVGRPDGIHRLIALMQSDGFGKVNLAISINAPNDAIRSQLMPINRVHPLRELRAAMEAWSAATTRPFMVEYVLIPGVNDGHEHALELAAFLDGLHCAVNVIPYNPRRDSPWPAPSRESASEFTRWLQQAGLFATLRVTKGRSVMAACGQLGNQNIRKRKPVQVSVSPP